MAKQKQVTVHNLRVMPERNGFSKDRLLAENEELRAKLEEAEETLGAISSGEVDAVVVSGPKGQQVFTLRGAEYAYHALVEAMNEGAATIADNGMVLYCNRQLSRILGLPPENVAGQPAQTMVAAEDEGVFADLFARAVGGESCRAEVQLRAHDATLVPAYVSLSPLPAEEPAAVCMVVTDLREHKQRDALIAAGELARAILQHAAEGIAVCDQHGRILLANEFLRELCGCDPHLQPFDRVLPLEHAAGEPFSFSSISRRQNIMAEQVVHRRRSDGRVFWLLLTAGPLTLGEQVTGCVLTLSDVTQQKLAEQSLLTTEKLAATGRLAATIAHEINNPLEAVTNILYLLGPLVTDPEAQTYVRMLQQQLKAISRITSQTLSFHRDSSHPSHFLLRDLVQELLDFYGPKANRQQITLATRIETEGPVLGFRSEIIQVISNLLINAIEATPAGGKVTAHLYPAPPWLCQARQHPGFCISILDNGRGIDPQHRARIFEPFFTTKGDKGTGLGLWVCTGVLSRAGGSLRVWSSRRPERSGTCFSIFLPAQVQHRRRRVESVQG